MRKRYLKLTKEQKARGVCFSSQIGDMSIHEITHKEHKDNPTEAEEKEKRLRDDSFFRNWGGDKNGDIVHKIRT